MKNAKLLKSAVLSTALLFVGGAQAQSDPGGSVFEIASGAAASELTVVVSGIINFGTHEAPSAAGNIVMVCASTFGGSATITPTPVTAGACGSAAITTSSATGTIFTVSLTSTDLTSGSTSITPALQIQNSFNGNEIASGAVRSVRFGENPPSNIYSIGGTLPVAANQAAGAYNGTFTLTASVN